MIVRHSLIYAPVDTTHALVYSRQALRIDERDPAFLSYC
jgi:hypothetical protein